MYEEYNENEYNDNEGNFYDISNDQLIKHFKNNPDLLNNSYIKAFYSSSINSHDETKLFFNTLGFSDVLPCKETALF